MSASNVKLVETSVGLLPEHVTAGGGAKIIPYPAGGPPHSPPAVPAARRVAGPVEAKLRAIAGQVLPTLLMLVVLLGIWQLSCSGEGSALPSPAKVWTESHEVIVHPFKGVTFDRTGVHVEATGDVGVAGHIISSLKRVAVGYGLAAIFGVALGILIGQSVFAYRALDPLFQVLRTVPPLAWLPISLAIFQQAQPSTIFLIFITAIWPIILNTATGVQNIPPTYRNVARVLNLNPLEYFVKIMLPATVPYMFTGLRIGVGMSWLAIVAAEMVQGGTGIGFFIWDSYNSSLLTDTIVALIWIGLVGFTLDRIVGWVGRRIAHTA
ncbi:MAG TPA: nitrate ABC transporter permease [Sphingomonas sp.]|nr:nitrate ABC transporter permease [Sphingomonas sp.]